MRQITLEEAFENFNIVTLESGKECVVVGNKLVNMENGVWVSAKRDYDQSLKINTFVASTTLDIIKVKNQKGKVLFDRDLLVDWGKVEVDTPIEVSHDGEKWIKRHFALFNKKEACVETWRNGCTSWSALHEEYTCSYSHARLVK